MRFYFPLGKDAEPEFDRSTRNPWLKTCGMFSAPNCYCISKLIKINHQLIEISIQASVVK